MTLEKNLTEERRKSLTILDESQDMRIQHSSLERNIAKSSNTLFLSAPYPGNQKFGGQPTGLLYALSILADRKESEYRSKESVKEALEVWCPSGTPEFEGSTLEKELTRYVREKKPKIVGVSTFSISYKNALHIRDLVKKLSPETIVVFGGAHEDNSISYYRKRGKIDADFVIGGDGAYLLDELYRIIEENPNSSADQIKEKVEKRRREFGKSNGAGLMLFNTRDGLKDVQSQMSIDSNKREPLKLDQLPLIPRYLLKDEDSLSRQFTIFGDKKTAQVMVGQGCPFGCGFCSEGIKRTWYDEDSPKSINPARNINHVERELQKLKKEGYQAIFFDDSTFFAKSKDYMAKLLSLLRKYNFEWGCQTTQNSVHQMESLLPEMRKSGLSYVYMGIEHYDGQMRDSFGKSIGGGNKFNGYSIEDTFKLLQDNGLRTGISLTFGHPDPASPDEETRESKTTASYSIDRTAELMDKFPNIAGVSLNLITYHPGTPNSERFERKGRNIEYTSHPNKRFPFTSFEEGIGPHPKGMTDGLASYIFDYAKQRIKEEKLWM